MKETEMKRGDDDGGFSALVWREREMGKSDDGKLHGYDTLTNYEGGVLVSGGGIPTLLRDIQIAICSTKIIFLEQYTSSMPSLCLPFLKISIPTSYFKIK